MHLSETQDALLVGVPAIADEIKQPMRRVRHWLQTGKLSSPRKVGAAWVVSRSALRREFGLAR
jgi:hypothetical protein